MPSSRKSGQLPKPLLTERKLDLSGWTMVMLERERRKMWALKVFLGLQALNLILVWIHVVPLYLAIPTNIYLGWRISSLV